MEYVWLDPDLDPVDVTGYHAALMIRETKDSAEYLLYIDDVGPGEGDTYPILGITVGTTDGVFTIEVDADVTAALDFDYGVYDLKVTSPGGVATRLVEGEVYLNKAVTR
jgi:hypothetical protein